jgi:hypothetical protein
MSVAIAVAVIGTGLYSLDVAAHQESADDVLNAGVQWTVSLYGGNRSDLGSASGVTSDEYGNIFVVGRVDNNVHFTDQADVADSLGRWSCFLAKYDSSGLFQWVRPVEEFMWPGIAIDSRRDIYVTGPARTMSATVGGEEGSEYDFTEFVFLSKHGPNGDLEWSRHWGATEGAWAQRGIVAVASDDSVYVAGTFSGVIDLDPGEAANLQVSLGDSSLFVVKLDAEGDFCWGKTWTITFRSSCRALACDRNGDVLILSKCGSAGHFSTPYDPEESASGCGSAVLSRINKDGNLLWSREWGEGAECHGVSGIALDDLGDIYLTGEYRGQMDFDPGPDQLEIGSAGNYLMKLNSDGRFLWTKTWETMGVSDLSFRQGHVYLAAACYWDFDIDPSPDGNISITVPDPGAYLVVMTPEGEYEWGSVIAAGCPSLAVDNSGNAVLAGNTPFLVKLTPELD